MPLLKEIAPKDAQLGATLALKYSGRLVLGIDKKEHWRKDADERTIVTFSGIGGAVELDEDYPDAAIRECVEETGAKPEIESAKRTLFVDYDNSVKEVKIDDAIKPAFVFRRVYLRGTESWQLFCPVYLARLHAPPMPLDLPALMMVTLEQLRQLKEPTRLHAILRAGAHIVEKGGERLPVNCYLAPFGTAEALYAIDASRYNLVSLLNNKS